MIHAVCLSSTGRICNSVYICLYVKILQFIYKISLQSIKYVMLLTETRKMINLTGSWINLPWGGGYKTVKSTSLDWTFEIFYFSSHAMSKIPSAVVTGAQIFVGALSHGLSVRLRAAD